MGRDILIHTDHEPLEYLPKASCSRLATLCEWGSLKNEICT